jgi:hypothetical protein
MILRFLSILILVIIYPVSKAQPQPVDFPIELESRTISGLPSLHSFSWAQLDGKWLIMSGRTNGLHGFQPPLAFPTANQNQNILLVNPSNSSVTSVGVSTLPIAIAEQISSSNLEFHQDGNRLVLIGGYGFSTSENVYKTFPSLISIDLAGLIQAIEANQPISPYFTQISDERMAVCGGYLGHIGNTYYLTFGHRFDGRYNPFNGGSYTQTYTDEIRFFTLSGEGNSLSIADYDAWWDQAHFHRRDFNLVPQINQNGSLGFTAFTGVFQRDVNLPHRTSVHFSPTDYTVDSTFHQLLNQYHTAYLPIHSANDSTMQTLFFGGIGEYYVNTNGQLVHDTLVPFTKTISMVTNSPTGLSEGWLPVQMPQFAGASAAFIPDLSAPFDINLILQRDQLPSGRIHVGTIVGGIVSDSPNTFMQSSGTTQASNQLIDVYINTDILKIHAQKSKHLPVIFQNLEGLQINIDAPASASYNIQLLDLEGRVVLNKTYRTEQGSIRIPKNQIRSNTGILICRVVGNGIIHTQKIVYQQ